MQHTSHLLMIKPVKFDFNSETSVNNSFQQKSEDRTLQEKALQEFTHFIDKLKNKGIDVTVINDTPEPHTPDSIFPNNWISFHENGTIFLYPMFAVNRRNERKKHVLEMVHAKFKVNQTIDLSLHESENSFLEGTGSMVLDRVNKIAYACLSPRTDITILHKFCSLSGYHPVAFSSVDGGNQPIYHTNVMMCVADTYVVICLETIQNALEKEKVIDSIKKTKKQLIEISYDQMNHFAGNMLQVNNEVEEKFLVMSTQAFNSLTKQQIIELEKFNAIIHSDIATIETIGGGSARCMIAEVFLTVN
jgi:hypothetical protein